MNTKLFLYLNSFAHYSSLSDSIIIFFAELSPFIFIIFEIYLYFIKQFKHEAIFAFYSMLSALMLNQLIGLFYFHNRPFMDHIAIVLKPHIAESSFPSDHTTFIFSILFSLIFYKKTKQYVSYLFIIALVGAFSRVIIGVHYPYDIFGGIVTGYIGALIVYLTKEKLYTINKMILYIDNYLIKSIKNKIK